MSIISANHKLKTQNIDLLSFILTKIYSANYLLMFLAGPGQYSSHEDPLQKPFRTWSMTDSTKDLKLVQADYP